MAQYSRRLQSQSRYWEPVDTEVARVAITTDSNGAATATFVPDKGGSYVAEATVTDSGGRTQVSNLDFWVMEEGTQRGASIRKIAK